MKIAINQKRDFVATGKKSAKKGNKFRFDSLRQFSSFCSFDPIKTHKEKETKAWLIFDNHSFLLVIFWDKVVRETKRFQANPVAEPEPRLPYYQTHGVGSLGRKFRI